MSHLDREAPIYRCTGEPQLLIESDPQLLRPRHHSERLTKVLSKHWHDGLWREWCFSLGFIHLHLPPIINLSSPFPPLIYSFLPRFSHYQCFSLLFCLPVLSFFSSTSHSINNLLFFSFIPSVSLPLLPSLFLCFSSIQSPHLFHLSFLSPFPLLPPLYPPSLFPLSIPHSLPDSPHSPQVPP